MSNIDWAKAAALAFPWRCPRCGDVSKQPGLCTKHQPPVLRRPTRAVELEGFKEGHGS